MDLDEIEEIYSREIENADKDFLKALADKKEAAVVEKIYSEKITLARQKYYKSIEAYLEKQKANLKKKESAKKKEEPKVYSVDTSSTDLTPKQKKKLEDDLKKFKRDFANRNWRREHTPYFVRYTYFYFKLHLKRIWGKVSDWFHAKIAATVLSIKNGLEKMKDSSDKAMKTLSGIPDKIIAKFAAMKKKAQERKEAKKKAAEEAKAVAAAGEAKSENVGDGGTKEGEEDSVAAEDKAKSKGSGEETKTEGGETKSEGSGESGKKE